uniref:EF-hand domain-containing protein n=1 Tax=Glossina brevipalpis TaxID=37001 RepID=A0A1A9X316_9MUSC
MMSVKDVKGRLMAATFMQRQCGAKCIESLSTLSECMHEFVHIPYNFSALEILISTCCRGATKLTKEDIEKVFSLYDRDNSGTIENEELKGFLKDLLELVKKDDYDAQDLKAFEETILRGVGYDKDGKISRKELTMILLTLAKMPPEDEQ